MTAPKYKQCCWCSKPMPSSLMQQDRKLTTRSMSIHRMDPDGRFCTLRCAAKMGVHAMKQGEDAVRREEEK